ncbi:MAG: hypothetical protein KIS94_02375 [Chitinophagales bacterium]|nr:hypothetical protein [Chitinophagales bacterium]
MPAHLYKLKKTLTQLDKATLKKFQLYLRSPYFKVPDAAADLFDYLLPLHPRFADAKTTPEAIANACKKLATAKTQANNASLLLQHLHIFMAIEHVQQTPGALPVAALRQYKQQHYFYSFEQLHSEARAHNSACAVQNAETLWHRHLLTELQYTGFDARLKRHEDMELQPVVDTLDDFHALKKVRYLCEIIQRHYTFGTPLPAVDETLLRPVLLRASPKKEPYMFLFTNVFRMLQATDYTAGLTFYNRLKKFAETSNHNNLQQTMVEITEYAKCWCRHWINRGYKEIMPEYLWWIDYKMNHGLILLNEVMQPTEFTNTVIVAYHLGQPSRWIHHYVETYHSHLPENLRHPYALFGKGMAFYAEKKYTEAIRSFMSAQIKNDDVVNAATRQWEFMARYDEGDTCPALYDPALLLNTLDSFKQYLKRHHPKLTNVKPGFEQFIHYANLLVRQPPRAKALKILTQLNAQEHFPGKAWLAQQLGKKTGKR